MSVSVEPTSVPTPAGERAEEGTGATADAPAEVLRPHAEDAFADELATLAAQDDRPRPARWRLSPWAVATYLLGGTLPDGTVITPKYVGPRRIVEVAVSTLATDRALLLLGVPGTAKTWVSEHLAAAVSGDSTLLVQGTAGTPEEAIRYGWNYAQLLARGPSRAALVPSPVMRALAEGMTARVEELTRIPADVQDTLITILSEKTLPIPELGAGGAGRPRLQPDRHGQRPRPRGQRTVERAAPPLQHRGAATAGDRRSRSRHRLAPRRPARAAPSTCPAVPDGIDEIRRVVTVFRELRDGITADGAYEAEVAQRHPVHRRGDLRRQPMGLRRPPTSATACCGRATSRPASSAQSSVTPRPTASSGRSIWRRSSASGTAGRTSTGPAGR